MKFRVNIWLACWRLTLLQTIVLTASTLRAQSGFEIIPLQLPGYSQSTSLPIEADNSLAPWFPPVYSQNWYPNCQQAAGIYYALTYSLNRVRRDTADDDHHRMAANFTFNFFNKEAQSGVSYFESFRIVKEAGNPTIADFGRDNQNSGYYWMNGYDKYFRAMHNRIDQVYSIPLNTLEGLTTMKHWLFDHLDGSEWGGIAVFSAHAPYGIEHLPPESPHAGFSVMTRIITTPSHALTIVGYNDSIRFDINADGVYTNDTDINNDGRIDLGDWEIGGYKVANSMGVFNCTGGYFYLMYSAFAQGINHWGAANESAYALTVRKDYSPLATARIELSHNLRNRLSLKMGVTLDLTKDYPDEILEYQIFNYLGSAYQLSGNDTLPNSNRLEIGLDISPLLSAIPSRTSAKFFLIADQKDLDDGMANGMVHGFSIITQGAEHFCTFTDVPLGNSPRTLLPVTTTIGLNDPPQIVNENLNNFQPGVPWTDTLQAEGGSQPYTYSLSEFYQTDEVDTLFLQPDVNHQPVLNNRTHLVEINLPFAFPFYNQEYTRLYISDNGTVNFDSLSFPYSYICNGLEYLKERKCIAAGYTISGLDFRPVGDSLYTSISDTCIIITWRIRSGLHGDTLTPMVKLHRSGKIEIFRPIYHGIAANLIYWGISSGDFENHQLSAYESSDVSKAHCIILVPTAPIMNYSLQRQGILTFEPSSEAISFPLRIKVTDQNRMSSWRDFQLSSALSAKGEVEMMPDDPFPYALQLKLLNHSSTNFSEARITVSSDHPRVRMNSTASEVGELGPGQVCILNDRFKFSLTRILSRSETFFFKLFIEKNTGERATIYTRVTLECPKIELIGYIVDDGHDLKLSPGETSELTITLTNIGLTGFERLYFKLLAEDTAIDVFNDTYPVGHEFQPGQMKTLIWQVKTQKTNNPNRSYPLTLQVNDSSTYQQNFHLQIPGESAQALIVDVAKKSKSSDTLQVFLKKNNITFRRVTSPVVDNNIPATFLLLGSSSGQYELSNTEAARYADYLMAKGSLYVEGFNYWHYGGKSRLTKMLKYKTVQSVTSRFDSLKGSLDNFFANDRVYLRTGNTISTYTLSMLGNSKPLFESDVAAPRTIVYSKDTTYKVIGSMAEIGNMTPVLPLTTRGLIGSYCAFLGLDTAGIHPLFHTLTRHVHEQDTVKFTDDSSEGTDTWQWEFTGGTPTVSSLQHPEVVYNTAGTYPVKLTIWKDGVSRSITRQGYVKVATSAGIEPIAPDADQLTVFPNPARHVTVANCPFGTGDVTIEWHTLQGALIAKEQRKSQSLLQLSLRGLPAGPAVVSVIQGQKRYSAIVIVQ